MLPGHEADGDILHCVRRGLALGDLQLHAVVAAVLVDIGREVIGIAGGKGEVIHIGGIVQVHGHQQVLVTVHVRIEDRPVVDPGRDGEGHRAVLHLGDGHVGILQTVAARVHGHGGDAVVRQLPVIRSGDEVHAVIVPGCLMGAVQQHLIARAVQEDVVALQGDGGRSAAGSGELRGVDSLALHILSGRDDGPVALALEPAEQLIAAVGLHGGDIRRLELVAHGDGDGIGPAVGGEGAAGQGGALPGELAVVPGGEGDGGHLGVHHLDLVQAGMAAVVAAVFLVALQEDPLKGILPCRGGRVSSGDPGELIVLRRNEVGVALVLDVLVGHARAVDGEDNGIRIDRAAGLPQEGQGLALVQMDPGGQGTAGLADVLVGGNGVDLVPAFRHGPGIGALGLKVDGATLGIQGLVQRPGAELGEDAALFQQDAAAAAVDVAGVAGLLGGGGLGVPDGAQVLAAQGRDHDLIGIQLRQHPLLLIEGEALAAEPAVPVVLSVAVVGAGGPCRLHLGEGRGILGVLVLLDLQDSPIQAARDLPGAGGIPEVLAAVGTVPVLDVALADAGGGHLGDVGDIQVGAGLRRHGQGLDIGAVQAVVDLQVPDRELRALGIRHSEAQGGHGLPGGEAVQVGIGDGDLTLAAVHAGVGGIHGNAALRQGQLGSIIGNGELSAVGGDVLALRILGGELQDNSAAVLARHQFGGGLGHGAAGHSVEAAAGDLLCQRRHRVGEGVRLKRGILHAQDLLQGAVALDAAVRQLEEAGHRPDILLKAAEVIAALAGHVDGEDPGGIAVLVIDRPVEVLPVIVGGGEVLHGVDIGVRAEEEAGLAVVGAAHLRGREAVLRIDGIEGGSGAVALHVGGVEDAGLIVGNGHRLHALLTGGEGGVRREPGSLKGGPLGILVLAPDHGIELLAEGENLHLAAAGDGIRQVGSSGDGALALGHGGDGAVFIHGGDGLIAAGPGDAAVLHGERQHAGRQALGLAGQELQRGGGNGDALRRVHSALAQEEPVGADVHGVVIELQEVDAVGQSLGGEGQVRDPSGVLLLGIDGPQTGAAVSGIEQRRRKILVFLHAEGQGLGAALRGELVALQPRRRQDRGGIVDDEGDLQGGTGAERVPIHDAVLPHVILRGSLELQGIAAALLDARRAQKEVGAVAGVHPAAAVHIVVGGVQVPDVLLPAVPAVTLQAQHDLRGVADEGIAHLGELIAVDGVQGVPGGIVGLLRQDGIAAEVVATALSGVLNGNIVGILAAHIGRPGLTAGGIGGVAALFKHGGRAPVAVVAQHGDGVADTEGPLGGGQGLGENVALDVRAVGRVCQLALVAELQGHGDRNGAAGRDRHGKARPLQPLIGIVAGDGTVAVKVGLVGTRDALAAPGHVGEESVHIRGIAAAVIVEVRDAAGAEGLPVHGKNRAGAQRRGGGIQIGNAVICKGILGEELRREGIAPGFVRQILQAEREVVNAGLPFIRAQIRLHLAVGRGGGGVVAHGDVGLRCDGVAHVGKTRALLQHGPVGAGAAVQQRLGSGHQQALGEIAGGTAGLLIQAGLPDVLGHESRHAGDLGRGHGGAGHGLVGLAALHGAVDGVDAAAGGGDLRLHLQAAGNAPGGEVADIVILAMVDLGPDVLRHREAALIIGRIVALLLRRGLQNGAVRLADADAGRGAVVAGEVHGKGAVGIVIDDDGRSSRLGAAGGLVGKVDGAAGADQHLAGEIHALVLQIHEIPLRAVAADEDIVQGLPRQGGEGPVLGAGALGEEDAAAVHRQVIAGNAVVVGGSHREGIGVAAGAAVGLQADIVSIEVAAVLGVFHPAAGVAGGDADHHALLREAVQDGLVGLGAVGGIAGAAGAQGQVDGVRPQDNGVLDGGHVVGIIGAAALAEDLHGQELGIRGNALHMDALQRGDIALPVLQVAVGGGNARHVGAVLPLAVAVVGDVIATVHIVVAEGELGVAVELLRRHGGILLVGVELRQLLRDLSLVQQVVVGHGLAGLLRVFPHRIEEGVGVEALVIGVRAGVDDRDAAARAVVSGGVSGRAADHGAGGGHGGIRRLAPGEHHGLSAAPPPRPQRRPRTGCPGSGRTSHWRR